MKTTDIVPVIQKEISPIITSAEQLTIIDRGDMSRATEMLSTLNKTLDRIETEREKVTKPLNAALKAENGRWKPMKDTLTLAISTVRRKMGAWQTLEQKLADEKAERIASRVGSGKGHLSAEKAVEKLSQIDTPDHKIESEAGNVKFRPVKKMVIFAPQLLPREFLIPNEPLIKKALLDGVEVTGAKIEIVQEPVNSR